MPPTHTFTFFTSAKIVQSVKWLAVGWLTGIQFSLIWYMFCLHTEAHMLNSKGLLVMDIKQETKYKINVVTISFFYIV
jgi:hypothetical protein